MCVCVFGCMSCDRCCSAVVEHDKEQREMQQRLQAERNQKDMERRASDAIEVHQREEEERRQLEEEVCLVAVLHASVFV